MKIEIEQAEWEQMQERLARLEALLPARVEGGSAFAVVMNAVREVFEADPRTICSPARSRHVLRPKWCAIWLLRDVFQKNHTEIRKILRHKDHGFVTHAMKQLPLWRQQDKEYDAKCRQAGEICLRQKHVYLKAA